MALTPIQIRDLSDQLNDLSAQVALGGGLKNYISNPKFATAALGVPSDWSVFKTTLTSQIPTGSIGAADVGFSITQTSVSPLEGSFSGLLASTGVLAIGNGLISAPFTIDREDKAKVMGWSFAYETVIGTMSFAGNATNTWAVYIYAVDGTSGWIQPAGVYNLVQSSGVGIASGTFQTTSDSTQYRIALICVTATSGAVSLEVDDFKLGPQSTVQGAAISDWQPYTPTITTASGTMTNFVATGFWKREGDNLKVSAQIRFTGAVGTWAGPEISIPSGLNIDFAKAIYNDGAGALNIVSGIGRITRPGVSNYTLSGIAANSFGTNKFRLANKFTVDAGSVAGVGEPLLDSSSAGISNLVPLSLTTNDVIWIQEMTLPILGWSSNTVMSQDTDTRVIATRATAALPTGTIASTFAGSTAVVFSGTSYDLSGSYSTSTGAFTIPVSGVYKVSASTRLSGTLAAGSTFSAIALTKNGVEYSNIGLTFSTSTGAGTLNSFGSDAVSCVAGDIITIRVVSNATTPIFTSDSTKNFLEISRLSGPATIAASETVAMNRALTGGQSIPSGIDSVPVSLSTSTIDTHGIWVNGTGYNSVTGTWTTKPRAVIPVSGTYLIQFTLGVGIPNTVTGVIWSQVRHWRSGSVVNGYAGNRLFFNNSSGFPETYASSGSAQIPVLAGDEITIDFFQSTNPGANRTLSTEQRFGFFAITKVGY